MKKLLTIFLSVAMMLAMMPSVAWAEGEVVITIGSAAELAKIGIETEYPLDGNYELTSDIELSGEWTPIGAVIRDGCGFNENSTPFTGSFNGKGYTIRGLKLSDGIEKTGYGLFGGVENATISNIHLENVEINISAGETVGAICGAVKGGTIDNCTVSGAISANECGGIVGRIFANGIVKNCVNNAKINGNTNGAGIVCKAYYTRSGETMLIENCTNNGEIIGSSYHAGGIVAFNAADVKNCNNSGNITAGDSAGGIVGEQTNKGLIDNNKNDGNVTGENNAGGIVGWIRYRTSETDYTVSEKIEVTNNINHKSISHNNDVINLGWGGIVGTIYNCGYVAGNESTAKEINGGNFAAGIVGNIQSTEIPPESIPMRDIKISNNVSKTPLDSITGLCTDLYAYNNPPATDLGVEGKSVIENNSDAWVAETNGSKYTTLPEAVYNAGDTISVISDVTLTDDVTITGDKTLEVNATITADTGNFVLSDGVKVVVGDNGSATVKVGTDGESVTLQAGKTYNVSGGAIIEEVVKPVDPPTPPVTPPTPPAPKDPVTNTGTSNTDNATTNADLSKDTSSKTETTTETKPDGTTSTTTTIEVSDKTAEKIVDKAVEHQSAEIVVDASTSAIAAAPAEGDKTEVKLPAEIMQNIAEKTDADVTIKSDVAEVTLDAKAVEAVAEQAAASKAETVTLVVENTKNETEEMHFELSLVTESGKVTEFKGGNAKVTVSLNTSLKAAEKLVCVYIDDNGIYHKVDGYKNVDGTFTFITKHFSTYAIMAEEEADKVIEQQTKDRIIAGVENTTIKARSEAKKGQIRVIWKKSYGFKVDYFEVYKAKSKTALKKSTTPYFKTKNGKWVSYKNTKGLKKGTKYFYRVRGVREIDGVKYYTNYSTMAYRYAK